MARNLQLLSEALAASNGLALSATPRLGQAGEFIIGVSVAQGFANLLGHCP